MQLWEIQLIVLLDFVILKTTALDFKSSRFNQYKIADIDISHYVPNKQWFVLTPLYLAFSIFMYIPQNTAQSLVQSTEQCSGDCLDWYNFPMHLQSTAAPWETDLVTK